MKPLTSKVGLIVTIGLGVVATDIAYFMGKGDMLSTVKDVNSETADEITEAIDEGLNFKLSPERKVRLKIIRKWYNICARKD